MDYVVKYDDLEVMIELNAKRTRDEIIAQYIALRKEKGYTQEDIAKATKIARPNVARIESGKNSPTIEVLTKLAHALNMQLELRFVEKLQ